jgi:hypothetical protein
MKKSLFTISSKIFNSKKEAEEKATGYLTAGQFDQKMRLCQVVKIYKPTIKFKEVK